MTEYERGIEEGKRQAYAEIAGNPARLIEMLPVIARQAKANIAQSPIPEAQKQLLNKAIEGNLDKSQLLDLMKGVGIKQKQ